MTSPIVDVTPPVRADFLVSVAVVSDTWDNNDFNLLKTLGQALSEHFQFWELIAVVPVQFDLSGEVLEALRWIRNIRILRVESVRNFYRLRLIAASEAIGDVVILTVIDELASVDMPKLAREVYEANQVIVMKRTSGGLFAKSLLSPLGIITGYRVDSRDTLTAGFPRSALSLILERPQADLLLRFEQRAARVNRLEMLVPSNQHVPRRFGYTGRRIGLAMDLLSSAAPRILQGVAVLSMMMTFFMLLYGVYVILVWIVKSDIAEGWLTTSMLQVIIASFVGISLAAIAMAIVKLFDRFDENLNQTVVDEMSNTDFFSEIKELNIDMGEGDIDVASEKS